MIFSFPKILTAIAFLVTSSFSAGWDNGYRVDFANVEVNGGCKCIEARFKGISSNETKYYRYYYEETGNSLDQAKVLLSSLYVAQQGGNEVNILYSSAIASAQGGWERFSGITVRSP